MTTVLPKPVMWDAAFDYVRLTCRSGEGADEAEEIYRKVGLLGLAREEGEVPSAQRWYWLGYYGVNYGLVQAGSGVQGAILQATQWAAQAVREANPPFTGVPRVDVQVTVWYDRDPAELIGRYAQRSAAASKAKGASGWAVRHIQGYGDGDTTYLGRRSSETYIRIYDKGREQQGAEDYKWALRYEVEFKNHAAAPIWAGSHRTAPDRHSLASVVVEALRRRHVYLALPDHLVCPVGQLPKRAETTIDTRLAWLRNQVAPSIDKLLAEGVSLQHVKEALGLV